MKLVLLLLLLVPSFALMLKSGIFTMHDPHLFRQYEYSTCLESGTFPCRWAPDSGRGYGEPVFTFYGQFPYLVGELFHLLGFSILDSVKLVFICSLVFSSLAMYQLASALFGSHAGLAASIFYVYAPYRAVDVWVRGALNEALAFVFYPLLLYFSWRALTNSKRIFLPLFTLSLSLLIWTHNLSFLMFAPFLGLWIIFLLARLRPPLSRLLGLVVAGLAALLLSASYLLPAIAENSLVTLSKTTESYYYFQNHFVTLYQLFISRLWEYGGSTWGPNDHISLSVGHLHWLLALACLISLPKLSKPDRLYALCFMLCALIAIFLTHGKSLFIWNLFPPLTFIQFPWRFLAISTFFLSLVVGLLATWLPKYLPYLLVLGVVLFNLPFFRPDIWRHIGDSQQFSGPLWDEGRSASLPDYWPASAALPTSLAPAWGSKVGHQATYSLTVPASTTILFPIVAYPGWQATVDGIAAHLTAPDGYYQLALSAGPHQVHFSFTDTPLRAIANLISLGSIIIMLGYFIYLKFVRHGF